jgi:predicted AAA+ superfamily ATPase
VVTRGGADRGKQLECAAYLLLRRRFRSVRYWRGDREVDFVVESGGKPVPVQVSLEPPGDRHRQAVDEFQEAHPHAGEAVFITPESFERGVPELG